MSAISGEKRTSIAQANPKAGYLEQQVEIDAALTRAARSGWYILGQEVEAFEREFARYIGCEFGVGVASGTDAIELALRACEVQEGDLVFTVSHTAVATVVAIERMGAIPVLVDIDPATYTMDPDRLEHAIAEVGRNAALSGRRGRAVVPVHLYGHPSDMPAIVDISRRAGLRIVEDCAQAHGAAIDGRKVGTWGDVAAFSFYPTKNLGALGDGGMVVGSDAEMIQRLRAIRQYGWEERYVSSIRGCNSRLDELQAAVLRTKLPRLASDNTRRRERARWYDELLADTPLQRPYPQASVEHVYHQYVIRSAEREALQNHLAQEHVGTAVHYPVPVHLQPAYRGNVFISGSLEHTERAAREVLSLPMYPQLRREEVAFVCECAADWVSTSRTTA
jgi:dTDP-4-amino-4,6-dideoxygalactose transaminase